MYFLSVTNSGFGGCGDNLTRGETEVGHLWSIGASTIFLNSLFVFVFVFVFVVVKTYGGLGWVVVGCAAFNLCADYCIRAPKGPYRPLVNDHHDLS